MNQLWADLGMSLGMILLMFGMGLTLTLADFRRVASNPRATIVGTLLQLVVMPIVGILLASAFDLPPILSAGLVVVAACPGGMFSNMFVHFARAHTALSITLTATATLITLFTLPIWVRFSLTFFEAAEGADGAVEMPVIETALRLGTLTVLPVVFGMLARGRWPGALRFERRASLSGALLIVLGVALGAGNNPDVDPEEFFDSLVPAAAFALSALVVGVTVPILFRIPARDAVTIAVEMIVKNTLLGIVLVAQVLDFEAVLPIFAFAIFQTPGGILLLAGWRWLEKRGLIQPSEAVV